MKFSLKKFKFSPKRKKKAKKTKKFIDTNDKEAIIRFLANIMTGILVNFMLFAVFKLKFSWYSWIGYGIFIHLIEIRLIKWIRLIRFK